MNDLNVGDESVVLGNVSGNIGDKSVVVGATDENGNVNLNYPMAVGYGATAGKDSVAIGALVHKVLTILLLYCGFFISSINCSKISVFWS